MAKIRLLPCRYQLRHHALGEQGIVLNIPVGYFVAFQLGMGATGLIVGYIVGLSTAAILYGVQVARYLRYLRKIS